MADKVGYEVLATRIEGCPDGGTVWDHYKGGRYMVMAAAILESTQEPMVAYRAVGQSIVFVMPLREWNSMVEHNGITQPRFTRS